MAELVILIGLPASGKSTFYRERFSSTHDHVSKDRMRHHRRPERRQAQLIAAALDAGRSVVVDNTNATAAERAALIALGRAQGATITGYYFPTEPGVALRRNRMRTGKARVPDVAIFAIHKRLQPPSMAEGFDALYEVRVDEDSHRFMVTPAAP